MSIMSMMPHSFQRIFFPSEDKYQEYQKRSFQRKQAKALLHESQSFFQTKQYTQAINSAKDALGVMKYGKSTQHLFTPKEIQEIILPAFYQLAQANFELKQYSHVLFYCEQIFHFRPKDRKAKFLQSSTYLQTGSFSAAMKFYER